jgi:hypothetical protein
MESEPLPLLPAFLGDDLFLHVRGKLREDRGVDPELLKIFDKVEADLGGRVKLVVCHFDDWNGYG